MARLSRRSCMVVLRLQYIRLVEVGASAHHVSISRVSVAAMITLLGMQFLAHFERS